MAIEVRLKPVETLLFRGEVAAVGAFRCSPDDPLFHDSGPCSHHTFVFPRTTTAIRHAGGNEFVATPGSVVFYNEGQRYRRRAVSGLDASDWYTVAGDVLTEVLVESGGHPRDGKPFAVAIRRAAPRLFLRQRALFDGLASGARLDGIEVEEEVLGILRESCFSDPAAAVPVSRREADAVEAARELVARDPVRSRSLRELAVAVSLTPFRLCRAFRARTGETLTSFRHSQRLAVALERLRDPRTDLTDLAYELGYSSHSHFTLRFRRHFGVPPSWARARA